MIRLMNITVTPPDTLNQVQAELVAVAEKLANTPAEELFSDLVDKAVSFGLKVLAALLIYLLGAWLIRKIKNMVARILEKRGTDAAVASFVKSLMSIVLTIVLIIITVGALGVDTSSLAALLAGGGMAIGLALNGTVQNFAGGIMILIFKPFKAGDYIQARNFEGTVSEVNIVSTKLTTVDNKCIIIPNGILSNDIINNFSHNKIRRVDWVIDVEYGSDASTVKELLMDFLRKDPRVLTMETGAPADPFVALKSLASSSVQFVMRAWTKSEDYWSLNFDINEKVYNELPEHGINFPYQKLDVNIRHE